MSNEAEKEEMKEEAHDVEDQKQDAEEEEREEWHNRDDVLDLDVAR